MALLASGEGKHLAFRISQIAGRLSYFESIASESNSRSNNQRFPAFASLDVQIVRPFHVTVFHREHTLRAGIKVFNATSHFNPRDVQDNVSSPN